VRHKRPMRPKSPAAGPGPATSWGFSCQRAADLRSAHWAQLCSLRNRLLASRANSRAKEDRLGCGQSFLRNHQQRTVAGKMMQPCVRSGFLVLAHSVSWFAAARNERFGAEPGRAAVRRLRRMFSYFHSSTVCQERRETLNIYFPSQGGAVLMRDKSVPQGLKRVCENQDLRI
jgi:hypothetical protein